MAELSPVDCQLGVIANVLIFNCENGKDKDSVVFPGNIARRPDIIALYM